MSKKIELYNIEETNEDPCWSRRLTLILQSNLGYEYETNIIDIHSISLNCDLDL